MSEPPVPAWLFAPDGFEAAHRRFRAPLVDLTFDGKRAVVCEDVATSIPWLVTFAGDGPQDLMSAGPLTGVWSSSALETTWLAAGKLPEGAASATLDERGADELRLRAAGGAWLLAAPRRSAVTVATIRFSDAAGAAIGQISLELPGADRA